MKYIKKAEHKLSETAAYLFIAGLLICLWDWLKKGCKAIFKHFTELLITISFVGMLIAAEAFDNGAINFTVAFLFVLVLGILAITLIKLKFMESRANKK